MRYISPKRQKQSKQNFFIEQFLEMKDNFRSTYITKAAIRQLPNRNKNTVR